MGIWSPHRWRAVLVEDAFGLGLSVVVNRVQDADAVPAGFDAGLLFLRRLVARALWLAWVSSRKGASRIASAFSVGHVYSLASSLGRAAARACADRRPYNLTAFSMWIALTRDSFSISLNAALVLASLKNR